MPWPALPVPALARREDGQRASQIVTVEPSGELLDYVAALGGRAEKVRAWAVGPDEDNMLKISSDGRRHGPRPAPRRAAPGNTGQGRRHGQPDRRDLASQPGSRVPRT